jgi:hypothetical protein
MLIYKLGKFQVAEKFFRRIIRQVPKPEPLPTLSLSPP